MIRELVPGSHQRSELSNTILCIFCGWDQRRAFQSLIVWGKKLPLLTSVLAMGVWNAIECWFLKRLVLGIRSSVGTLALPLRPLYSNISLLSFLLFLRIPILTVQKCQSYSQFHNCNYLSQIWQRAFAHFLILPGEQHLGGPKPNCHNPGLGAPILYKLPLLPPGGKNISFSSGIQGFC